MKRRNEIFKSLVGGVTIIAGTWLVSDTVESLDAYAAIPVIASSEGTVQRPANPDKTLEAIAGQKDPDDPRFAGVTPAFTGIFTRAEIEKLQALDSPPPQNGISKEGYRLVPFYEKEIAVGFKVYGVKPKSAPARIGVKNGDVLLRANGYPLRSPEELLATYDRLKNETEVQFDVLREGKPVRLGVSVR